MSKSEHRGSTVSGCTVIFMLLLFLYGGINMAYAQKVLFEETFEDTLFSSRGWYDYSDPLVTTSAQHAAGSTRSCEFRWNAAGQSTSSPRGGRVGLEPVEGLTLTFYIKFSDNWAWTGVGYHPHFIMFVTDVDNDNIGPAYTHLTLYVEPVDGKMKFAMQDGQNIDMTHLNQNLVGVSENRAVAGGNGDSDGYGGTAYNAGGGVYRNGKSINTDSLFSDSPGQYYKGDWHQIKAHIQLNSIINGKGVANGVIQYWYDGQLVMDHHNVLMRTGQHPQMKLDQFLLLPYYAPPSGGVPHAQTIWIDDIKIVQDEQALPAVDPPVYNPVLINENFEDTDVASRGWYDSPNIFLDAVTYTQGAGNSAKFTWTQAGSTSPEGRAGRIKFDPVEGFTLSFYTRFSSNWDLPSDTSLAQSMFYFVTDKDDQWTNPLNTFLTAQVTASNGKLKLILSDYKNIDTSRLGQDLTNITENRAVNGGNGESDSYGGTYTATTNRKIISTVAPYFLNTPGAYYKNDWHQVKCHLQLNSIVNGKGVANGVVQMWYDGKQVMDLKNVMFRTGQHADMKFNQLMLLPYYSGGVLHEQNIWLDDIQLVKDEQILRIPVPLNPDMNGDGKVSLLDLLAFILKGVKTPEAPELDMNNDGVYSSGDALEMLRKVIKLRN